MDTVTVSPSGARGAEPGHRVAIQPTTTTSDQDSVAYRRAHVHQQQHQQQPSQTIDSSPTSSSPSSTVSSLDDPYDFIARRESGRHVQGLPASALATVDAVLGPLQDVDLANSDDRYAGDADGEDSEGPHSPPDHSHHQQHHIHYVDSSLSRSPPADGSRDTRSRQQFGLRNSQQKREFSPKRSKSNKKNNRVAPEVLRQQSAKDHDQKGSKEEFHDDNDSQGSRGSQGGHFYTYENPPLVPVAYQREFYERQLNSNGHQSLQPPYYQDSERPPLDEDQQLEMYRTKSIMSGLSMEQLEAVLGKQDGSGGYNFGQTVFREDPELEARIVKKLDRHLLPLLGILYLFSYLDRVNIGNARLFGLEEAVHLTNGQYNIALASFFMGYCIFEIPSNWILVRKGPRTWIPILMLVWGGISLALAWVTSFTGLVIARFALGTAEAGFVPGVLFYLTMFYKRSEHSFRISIFLCFNILAGACGGLLAAGISRLNGVWHLQGWQWIFILEAVPTMLLAILTWFVMVPSPATASFLTGEERIYAANRILMDSNVSPDKAASWKQTREALTDPKVYLVCLASLLLHIPSAGIVLFMPSLIADMGFTATTAQLLTAPAYAIAALRYLSTILALCGIVPTSSILASWLTNNCVGHAKRATALAMLVSAGALAGMAGTQVYRSDDAPRYQRGHLIMAGSIVLLILTAILLRFILARENKRRDDNHTKGLTLTQFISEAYLNLGEMHPNFRYTL
ncbi:hypothetical protein BGZ83_000589 [Gryganskiella cystojenkinii]|nr:hypothetical protein BGZ83_000589 [Gryganskiella cystojenkinii]